MSRGIGATQRRILAALESAEFPSVTVSELAQVVGCSGRQIRRAVRSLESYGLVIVSEGRNLGHRGVGDYGPLRRKWSGFHRDIPTAVSVKAGEPWPIELRGPGWFATVDSEFYREGMPAHGLEVATPRRIILAYKGRKVLTDAAKAELRQKVEGCQLSADDRAELERLTQ